MPAKRRWKNRQIATEPDEENAAKKGVRLLRSMFVPAKQDTADDEHFSDTGSSDGEAPRFCKTRCTDFDMIQGLTITLVGGAADVVVHLLVALIAFLYYKQGGERKPGSENFPFPTVVEVNDGFGYRKVKDLS